MSDYESQMNDSMWDEMYETEAQEKLEEHYYDYWYSDINYNKNVGVYRSILNKKISKVT